LHPTSLPGRYGIGDQGDAAYRFVDFLVVAQQSLWQVLPLGPTGYGDSPYQRQPRNGVHWPAAQHGPSAEEA
jgi:4-alpha-glucanotransferase